LKGFNGGVIGVGVKLMLALLVVCLTACTTAKVQPWERGHLSRVDMAWEPDAMQSAFREHIYTAKEGASGGASTGGGGCGCY
jgi:hypothetical protein